MLAFIRCFCIIQNRIFEKLAMRKERRTNFLPVFEKERTNFRTRKYTNSYIALKLNKLDLCQKLGL